MLCVIFAKNVENNTSKMFCETDACILLCTGSALFLVHTIDRPINTHFGAEQFPQNLTVLVLELNIIKGFPYPHNTAVAAGLLQKVLHNIERL